MVDLSKIPSLPKIPSDYNLFTLFSYFLTSLILFSIFIFSSYKIMKMLDASDNTLYVIVFFASLFGILFLFISGYNEAKEAENNWKENSKIDLDIKKAQLEQIRTQTEQIKKAIKK